MDNAISRAKLLMVSEKTELFDALIAAAEKSRFDVEVFNNLQSARIALEQDPKISGVILGLPLDEVSDFAAWIKIKNPLIAVFVMGNQVADQQLIKFLDNGVSDILHYSTPANELISNISGIINKQKMLESDHIVNIDAYAPAQRWIEMTLATESEYLSRVQRFSEILLQKLLAPEIVEQLCVALEEFGRNAMEWGNKLDHNKKVSLRILILDTEVIMVFEDEGDGFNWQEQIEYVPTKDLKKHLKARSDMGKRPGGLGLFMMRNMMDEVFYNGKGNMCVMRKKIDTPPGN